MILKPRVPGVTVRDPVTGRNLPDEGKAVSMTSFWRRRIADGSVVEVASSKGAPVLPVAAAAAAPKNLKKIQFPISNSKELSNESSI